jgi:virulence-associated protein VagC
MTVKILPGNGNSKRITIPREYHLILGDANYVQIKLQGEELIIKPQRMVDAPLLAQ